MAKTLLLIAFMIISIPVNANPKETYFQGALSVYSQMDEFSKSESERFLSFVKNRWEQEGCKSDCLQKGQDAALEYVNKTESQFARVLNDSPKI
ncbi:hypothetical protein TH1_184 [Shewanella phage Thanatos-1]|nr:hypothetical protein TH1_184 [Shewanella phage Thanatos-1]